MSELAIQVENLGKRYQLGAQQKRYPTLREALTERAKHLLASRPSEAETTLWALRQVSFNIRPGEVVGIIGRNGAGKSTLLKLLAHITHPSEGRIILNGRVGSLLEVGTGFHPELTGRDNIYLNGAILGMSRAEIRRKFDEIVAFAEIEKFLDTPVKRYSSGMYVRLAFAVAAHLEPEILVVDEVLSVGDAAFQLKCMGKMKDVSEQGRTVLFVSHNLQAVTSLCERGIILSAGQLVFDGAASEAVAQYLVGSGNEPVLECNLEDLVRKRSDLGELVRLTKVSLEFPGGSAQVWEPLKFDLAFTCRTPNYIFSLIVEVWHANGVRAFTTESEDTGLVLQMKKGQVGLVSVVIPNPNLAPGRYVVSVLVNSGGKVVDWLADVLKFDIVGNEQLTIRKSEKHLGNRARGQWEVLG